MYCSQKCQEESEYDHHLMYSNNSPAALLSAVQLLTQFKQVDDVAEILMGSPPKTIFDFDLRSMDKRTQNLMNLELINSLPPKTTSETFMIKITAFI